MVTRLSYPGWFADVPCEFAAALPPLVVLSVRKVVAVGPSVGGPSVVEMRGTVVHRDDDNVLVSCGGLLVHQSAPGPLVDVGDDVHVHLTGE